MNTLHEEHHVVLHILGRAVVRRKVVGSVHWVKQGFVLQLAVVDNVPLKVVTREQEICCSVLHMEVEGVVHF